jgi:4-amino-4-deoxy-L-arabinose transferase-like glycosyltransferase
MPNFVSGDEFRRIGQPMKVARYLLTDPSVDSIRQLGEAGAGRDATTYLHGLVLLPLFVLIVITGRLGSLVAVSGSESVFVLWNSVPAWFWTASLTITRLLNVVLVVGSVYMIYRIGTILTDRQAGRMAAVFTALSLGVIHTAHEVNEDTPALFLLLIVLYLSIRYVHTENNQYFLIGCGVGGLAIAFKLTAGVVVFFLGVAFLITVLNKPDPLTALWQPRLLACGLLVATIIIYLGIPNLLLRGPEWLIESRLVGGQTGKTGGGIPPGYSATVSYLNAFGLPLTLGVTAGLSGTLRRIGVDREYNNGELILLVGLAIYLIVYFLLWQNFSTHHILLSIPLLTLVFGGWLSRQCESHTAVSRVVFIVLLLTTALYAGAGLYQFTNDARDEATEWLESNADPEATVTVFTISPDDVGLVHGRPIGHYPFNRAADVPGEEYTEWLLSVPDRGPEYIQWNENIDDSKQYPRRAAFEERLSNGDRYGYVVAAEFGEHREMQSRTSRLVRAGLFPKVEKRAGYTMILAKNESLA